MFDLTARNQALQVMKLKSYLNLNPETRAQWCYVVDMRFARHDLKTPKVDYESHINPFTQTWRVKRSELNHSLKDMLDCARKMGVKVGALLPRKSILLKLPMWHHFAEDPSKKHINNNARCRCLRGKHHAFEMGDAVTTSARLANPDHIPNSRCLCQECVDDRTLRRCSNPHGCAMTARMKLDRILPQWDPRQAEEDMATDDGLEDDDNEIQVFRRPARENCLADCFRIFTNKKAPPEENLPQPPMRRGAEQPLLVAYASSTSRCEGELLAAGAGCG